MKVNATALWLAAPATLVAGALPGSAQVFLTEEQAVAAVFGETAVVHREVKTLTPEEKKKLTETSQLRFPESAYTFLIGGPKGARPGYALVLNEIGKSEPITFMVAMSAEGKVTDVMVLVFRESRGWEVREQRFVRQFRGKTVSDPIRVNQDIVNYVGATLSSKALARGVKKALVLLEHFYPEGERGREGTNGFLRVEPKLPSPVFASVEESLYRQTRYLMGTLCEVRLWATTPRAAACGFDAAFAELKRIDGAFSNYKPESELSRVNRFAGDEAVGISEEFWRLLFDAVRESRHSGGLFDVTVGPLARAWGFFDGQPAMPTAAELERARLRTGSDKVRLNSSRRTVRFRVEGMEIDFGGYAKGYAAEQAARALRQAGMKSALVSLGGSSIVALRDAPRTGDAAETGWILAVRDPAVADQAATYIELRGECAVSTSGTYEQSFVEDGRRFSHLLDPRMGQPLGGFRSATVMARSGRRAEVLSKELLFASDERRTLHRRLRGADWVLLGDGVGGANRFASRLRNSFVLQPA